MTQQELFDAQREQFAQQTRQQALIFAQQRAKPEASIAEIIAEAELLVEFVLRGVKVAAPEVGEQ
jgi:hypothetical protein